jgi:hypothetical protein
MTAKHNLYCWGYLYWILNQNEDLSEPHWYLTPQLVELNGIEIDSFVYGNPNICARAVQRLYCWGAGLDPEDGLSSYEPIVEAPTLWGPSDFRWKTISSQGPKWCGINQHDDLYCWGYFEYSEVMAGDSCAEGFAFEGWCAGLARWVDASSPFQLEIPGIKWRDVNVRGNVCAIAINNSLFCAGYNDSGQVGIGSNESPSPVPVCGGLVKLIPIPRMAF